jgi:microcystin-dependent protein
MSQVRANSITNAAGTGAPDFPNGLTNNGAAVAAVPTGVVATFARNTAPTGWLKANGAAVSRTTYATLFSAIGTTFGVGDGSTTFNLPDLRGRFTRNWADDGSIDSGRSFGSAQTDDFKAHTHTTVEANQATSPQFSGVNYVMMTNGTANIRQVNSTGGTETRPTNIALLACIKF